MAICTMPAVCEHRPLQSLVVARAAGVGGKNDIRTACFASAPNNAARYGPIVGGIELLQTAVPRAATTASIGEEVPVESIICNDRLAAALAAAISPSG